MNDPYRVLQVVPGAEPEVLHAAYRALALKYHPDRDGSAAAARRMADLNAAYAVVRDPVSRAQWDAAARAGAVPQAFAGRTAHPAAAAAPARSAAAGTRLEFGRYAGWTLRDLARRDPDYLRWLARHASGLRYRTEIYHILGRLGATAA